MNPFAYAQEMFETVYGKLSVPVVLFDNSSAIIKANRAFCDLSKTGLEQLHTRTMPFFFRKLAHFFETGRFLQVLPDHSVTELTDAEETVIPVALHYAVLPDESQACRGMLGFITDLQHTQALEEKIRQVTVENETFRQQLDGKAPEKTLQEKIALEKKLLDTQKFLENVLDSCGDGIIYVRTDGKITLVNESFAAMLGKKKEEIEGILSYELGPSSGAFRLTTGETVSLDQSYWKYQTANIERLQNLQSSEGGAIGNWEFYAFHKNGHLVPLDLTISTRKTVDGIFTGSVISARDLTKKRIAEKKIQATRDFFEKVVEASYDGIVVSDTTGVILSANSAFERLTGCNKEELQGKKLSDVLDVAAHSDKSLKERIAHLQTHDHITYETSFRRKNGDTIHLEHGISLVESTAGEGTAGLMVSIIRDTTENKKAAQALHEAYQFRNQFFTNITHAFRTPLTLFIGPIEGMLRGEFGKLNKEISDQLGLALRNSRQLLKMIDQLLDFSRAESGKRTVIYVNKDLEQLIAAVLDSFSFIAKKKKIKLSLNTRGDIPYVSIDPVKMEKTLFNIIGNAFKFTPDEGSITVTIESSALAAQRGSRHEISLTDKGSCIAARQCDYIKISIADTGIGIREEDLSVIFDRFKQGNWGMDQRHEGSGIGLAHARELIELMGGEITVQSTYEKGSTFCVYLPVEHTTEEKSLTAEETDAGLSVQPEIELSDIRIGKAPIADRVSGTRPLILILDDNPDVLTYISDIIREHYDFMTALSGRDGLQKLEKHMPDVILCDIMMPEMDGYAFLKHIKANPSWKYISFIFLTARADTEMKIEGLEEGADDYIVKPFNSLELLARIRSLLRIRELTGTTQTQAKTITSLTQKLQDKYSYGNIIGSSPPMRKIYQLLEAIKDSDTTVLITGETGTGKELIANAIHYGSPRKNTPMISVNCGAIPRELMESEFFGHVKGAFTGAIRNKNGFFTEADGGTLFLDEIGEMDKEMQVKLLRALERGEILRVGNATPIKVHIRLIAATNKDLRAEVHKGTFREDLFYRICVLPIHVPPLRERPEDIPLLIEHFLKKYREKLSCQVPPLTESELKVFTGYSYPGNVRELENIIERFCLLGGTVEGLFADRSEPPGEHAGGLPYDELLSSSNPLKTVGHKAKLLAEKNLVMHVLRCCNNDYSEAAGMLNIGLSSLYRKVKEFED